jgi:hypothetical protein
MPAAQQTEELLRHLRAGELDSAGIAYLEQLKADELVADLTAAYPFRFQERRLGRKWEVGMARSLEFRLVPYFFPGSQFLTFMVATVLQHCVMLSGEAEAVTGISATSRIVVKPIHKPFHGVALATSRGFKLDKLPDGWEVKALSKKRVKLTEDFLQQRGWRFDLFRQVAPQP